MADEQIELENSLLGKLKLTGPTTVLLLLLAAAGASGFGVYMLTSHEATAKEREATLVKVLEKLSDSQDKMAVAQRQHTCAIAFRRENQTPEALLRFCKDFAQ
jgi:hypothetical protein